MKPGTHRIVFGQEGSDMLHGLPVHTLFFVCFWAGIYPNLSGGLTCLILVCFFVCFCTFHAALKLAHGFYTSEKEEFIYSPVKWTGF